MRVLLDQNVPRSLVDLLRAEGHDADHTSLRGLGRAEDEDLMALAASEGRVLVTFDQDFARLVALEGATTPSIVLLRLAPADVELAAPRLVEALASGVDALVAGAVVVVERDRFRVRRLPIG